MQRYLFLGEETRLMKIVNIEYKHSWEYSEQTSARYHKTLYCIMILMKTDTYFDLYG